MKRRFSALSTATTAGLTDCADGKRGEDLRHHRRGQIDADQKGRPDGLPDAWKIYKGRWK